MTKADSKNYLRILQYHRNVVVYYVRSVRIGLFLYVSNSRFLQSHGKLMQEQNQMCLLLKTELIL